eukprot:147528-Pleurochrysis_carterae.AAC.1
MLPLSKWKRNEFRSEGMKRGECTEMKGKWRGQGIKERNNEKVQTGIRNRRSGSENTSGDGVELKSEVKCERTRALVELSPFGYSCGIEGTYKKSAAEMR